MMNFSSPGSSLRHTDRSNILFIQNTSCCFWLLQKHIDILKCLTIVMLQYTCNVCDVCFFFTLISGSLFGSSAATPGLFGQQQTTATAFGQKPGGLFGTPTSSTTGTGFGSGFGTTSLFGQSTSGQTVCVLKNIIIVVRRDEKKINDLTCLLQEFKRKDI